MLDSVTLIPLFPLFGALLLLAIGKRIGEPHAGVVASVATGLSFICAIISWLSMMTHGSGELRRTTHTFFEWIKVGRLEAKFALLADPLSITMALFVTGVGCLIHIYAIGYMKGDQRYRQFFIYMNLFVFSMATLVLANNFLLMFLGWEGVGACSYLLIGFWFERRSAATAAKKAFVVNRIGDLGLMLGIFMIYSQLGTLTYFADNLRGAIERFNTLEMATATAIGLLLFVGAVGKSAQLPLYVWLPDAMEGPTPVSALIHAATMVTAGVYLMARVAPLVVMSNTLATTIAVVGITSAVFAALVACAQNDIKRVLAYSTMSQLGYMFVAIGARAFSASVFHMVTHAFFKALLFLSAGAVIHALHEQQDLKKMGNLRKYVPLTFGVFVVGWLSLAGVPPLSGFWSKDEVLIDAWHENKFIWAAGLLTVLLTAYYMSRLVFLAFLGKEHWGNPKSKTKDKNANRPHEVDSIMRVPMLVLAVLSIAGGILNANVLNIHHALRDFLSPVVGRAAYVPDIEVPATTEHVLMLVSVIAAVVGIVLSWFSFKSNDLWPRKLEPAFLAKAFYIDKLYETTLERPGHFVATWLNNFFEHKIVDGSVNGTTRVVAVVGNGLRRVQNGYVRSYALVISFGVILVLVWALVRSSS